MLPSLASPPSWRCIGVCLLLLTACEVPAPSTASRSSLPSQGFEETSEGWPTQGQMLHGSSLESVYFTGGTLNALSLDNLHLEKGQLVAEQAYSRPATTPVLLPCSSPQSGTARDCGWTWMGVGTCTARASVHLGGGGCRLGTCSGDAMLRICPGTASCTDATRLASSDDACGTLCPDTTFSCPSSGTYSVLAAPYQSSASSWDLQPQDESTPFPGHRTVRGTDLIGARLQGTAVDSSNRTLDILDVRDAQQVVLDTGKPWDPAGAPGETFLYSLRIASQDGRSSEYCRPPGNNPTDPNQTWAVPVSSVYEDATGNLDTVNLGRRYRFSFGCNSDVISKCYRWGYKPWKDEGSDTRFTLTHQACTRMARADYCGNGVFHTEDGTHIAFWDRLVVNPQPAAGTIPTSMPFEAGWSTTGAVCLSHLRWATRPPLPNGCQLVGPSYLYDGGGVECPPGQLRTPTGQMCATICDTADAAVAYGSSEPVRLLNHSGLNGLDGGVPDGGGT